MEILLFIILLFSLKEFEILHQEKRGQVKTIVMEHFKNILFHTFRPDNQHHTYVSKNVYTYAVH